MTLKTVGALILILWGSLALAKDHITDQALFEDVSGQMAFESLPQERFQPFTGMLNQGYSPSTFWLRLRIDPPGMGDRLILRVRPSYLDEVVLYDPALGTSGPQVRGDEQMAEDRYQSLNLNFTIAAGSAPRDVWLRIRTDSTLLVAVDALDLDAAIKADVLQQLKSSFYVSLMVLFIVWGLLNWWALRDPIIAWFVVYQGVSLLFMLGILGYIRYFWPNGWTLPPGIIVDVIMGPYGAAAFWFEYRFLREFRANRNLLAVLRWMPAYLLPYFLLLLLGASQWAFKLAMGLYVLAPFLFFALVLTVRPSHDPSEVSPMPLLSRRTLLVIYGVILLGLSSSSLPAMGWVPANFLIFDGLLIYSLISGLAILVILQLRIRNSDRQRIALERRHQDIHERFIEEQARAEEKGRFLAMLTHELRTPMAVIRMTLGATESGPLVLAERSIEEMGEILDRCLTADQLEQGKVVPHLGAIWLCLEVRCLITRCANPSRVELHAEREIQIQTDVVLLRLVILSLIDNALKYSEAASMIRLAIVASKEGLFVTVENQPGKAGWPDPEQVFQKYYRSPKARCLSGTGLGLYLAHRLSEGLGGSLRYTPSNTHIGFTLCLTL
jgi:signal transduction histidine kinase